MRSKNWSLLLGYIFLVCSTLLVTVWALCYKVAVKRGCELRSVNLWLYLTSGSAMLVYFFVTGHKLNLLAGLMGLGSGLSCYYATLTFFYHIRTGVLAVSWTVIGLALSFPVAASIFLWGEHPSRRQIIGLLLIPVAVVLCNPGRGKAEAK